MNNALIFLYNLPKNLLIFLIDIYRLTLSPYVGRSCRFEPTCSQYGREALEIHGALKGTWLTIKRVGRCSPLHEGGYDPVPGSIPDPDTPPNKS